jgi:ComF family protein
MSFAAQVGVAFGGLFEPVLAAVFPAACPACSAALARPSAGPLCAACWDALPRHSGRVCDCGEPLAVTAPVPCGRCRRGLSPFRAGASLGPFAGSLRVLVHELKYRGRRRSASRAARLLFGSEPARRVLAGASVLVPVPLHPRRLRQRGFNQSLLLARALGRLAGLPVADALARRIETATQTGLSAAARRRNVKGAFRAVRPAAIAGRVVVLVDDVLTTGATARACAQALRGAGASAVRLLTLARAA